MMYKPFLKLGQTEPVKFVIYIGCFAGIFIELIRFVASSFKFTTISNGFLINMMFPNLTRSLVTKGLLGGLAFVLFSILFSFIYMLLFRLKRGAMWGIGLGVAVWIILFLLLPTLVQWPMKSVVMSLETQVFELCLFIVWGLFIGYSIAFEFTDEASYEPIYVK